MGKEITIFTGNGTLKFENCTKIKLGEQMLGGNKLSFTYISRETDKVKDAIFSIDDIVGHSIEK